MVLTLAALCPQPGGHGTCWDFTGNELLAKVCGRACLYEQRCVAMCNLGCA